MKPFHSIFIVLTVAGTAVPMLAQSAKDPFEDLDRNLQHAAAQEMELAGSLNLAPPPVTAEVDQQTVPLLPHSSQTSFLRLQTLLPSIRPIFEEEGVPLDLILVGFVESGYRPDAVSRAQAAGIWQFMPETAQRFGLINEQGDFRTDVLRSTRAAARYLKVLLDEFQDWRLALAAYNAGEDRVEAAIRKARTRDFATIARLRLLPEETVQYVPAVLDAIAEARNRGLVGRDSHDLGGFYE
jgi:hypothetical protein